MYKFKVGDTVRSKYNIYEEYVIAEITPSGWHRRHIDDMVYSYQAESLELVCPAGYRPVRKDEMHECLRVGDAAINKHGDLCVFKDVVLERPYVWNISTGEYRTFFRPIEKRDWGWISADNSTDERGLTEKEAKTAAENFCIRWSMETIVFRIVGKFTVKTETKVEWNDA